MIIEKQTWTTRIIDTYIYIADFEDKMKYKKLKKLNKKKNRQNYNDPVLFNRVSAY